MGCGSSKAEESRVVALCRERRDLIRKAVDRRYALSAAHAAYFRALAAVGDALERFVMEELAVAPSPPGSPLLSLSSEGKGKSKSMGSASGGSSSVSPLSHSLSDDGSHLHLSSGLEADASPEKKRRDGDGGGGGGGGESSSSPLRPASVVSSPYYSFMRSSSAIPTMMYEPNTQEWQHSSNSGYGYGYEHGYGYGYPQYGYPSYGVAIGSPSPGRENSNYYNRPMSPPGSAAAAPPTPLPPPEGSAWEFFDPFNTYEQLLPAYGNGRYGFRSYASSPNSSEVREQEGIPDLEDETEIEAMKKVKKGTKVVREDSGGKEFSIGSYKTESTQEMGEKDEKNAKAGSEEKESKSSSVSNKARNNVDDDGSSGKKKGVRFEEETSFVTEESRPSSGRALSTPSGKSPSTPTNGKPVSAPSSANALFAHGIRDVVEVVKEINEHFHSAANKGEEVSRILEVGKLPYRTRSRMYRVIPFRIWSPVSLTMLTSSRPSFKHSRRSAASTIRSRASNSDSEKHWGMKSGNLSSTLEKLYVWEKKLYNEIKDEEKLRIIYDRKYKRLKALDRGGAEFYKIDSTRASTRKLSTKISIVIKSVDAISNRMHKIRDEELQPQLIELIQGLDRMWKSVVDCHQKQLQALVDSKSHNLMAKIGSQRQSIAKATRELELDLLHLCHCFREWISTQKAYIEALNGWLMKWLPEEQEQTPDGVAPFSPGRIGAPAVYIISNDWFHAIKRISEDKATQAMHDFAAVAHELWESQNEEQHLRQQAEYISRDYDRRHKSLQQDSGMNERMDIISVAENGEEHHDGRVTELDLIKKRLEEVKAKHEETVKQVQDAASSILQTGLIPIFEALETFCSETLKAYKAIRLPNEVDHKHTNT